MMFDQCQALATFLKTKIKKKTKQNQKKPHQMYSNQINAATRFESQKRLCQTALDCYLCLTATDLAALYNEGHVLT